METEKFRIYQEEEISLVDQIQTDEGASTLQAAPKMTHIIMGSFVR